MQASYLKNQQLFYADDIPVPQLEKNQALVKVELAGICATDLALCQGYYPFEGILGHEFVGTIVDAPQAPERVGQRVVGEINMPCGHCTQCQQGRTKHCSNRKVLGIKDHHGAFADYLTLELDNLLPVADSISNQQAVFTEPLAAALAIQQQIHITGSMRVLVIGGGRLGQLIARTLALTGCDLQVVARYSSQQQLLQQHYIETVAESNIPHATFDVVVEASGSTEGFKAARSAVRPRGTIVLKTTTKAPVSIDSSWVVDEIKLIGSRCGDFKPALRLLEQGLIHPEDLIMDSFPLAQTKIAFKKAAEKGVLKVLFEMNS
ncbi:MAG: alcohol dehydrogenase catalytic domain-containing protein [Methylococcaceae bacterium]|nr:alcohol dehydrogenase catalytic domain-containing protein [Methylococcaceae bacterium]